MRRGGYEEVGIQGLDKIGDLSALLTESSER